MCTQWVLFPTTSLTQDPGTPSVPQWQRKRVRYLGDRCLLKTRAGKQKTCLLGVFVSLEGGNDTVPSGTVAVQHISCTFIHDRWLLLLQALGTAELSPKGLFTPPKKRMLDTPSDSPSLTIVVTCRQSGPSL